VIASLKAKRHFRPFPHPHVRPVRRAARGILRRELINRDWSAIADVRAVRRQIAVALGVSRLDLLRPTKKYAK